MTHTKYTSVVMYTIIILKKISFVINELGYQEDCNFGCADM